MPKRKQVILGILLFIFCVVFITKYFFCDFWRLPQKGMYPTICTSKRFLCKRHPYKIVSEVKRGDIIVFRAEWKNGKIYNFIWRVVGLPGDVIEMQDNRIVINGGELKKEKLQEDGEFLIYTETNGEASYNVAYEKDRDIKESIVKTYEVPQDCVFVLGDNRDNAVDSRKLGMIPFDSIIAKKL
jgi:signal peptidase I